MAIRRTVKLLLDKAAARKVERDLKAQTRRVKADQKRAWKEIGQFVVGAFGVRALARFTKEMFRLGSAASETGSKFRTVFGTEAAAELDVFIEKFGALAGLTKNEGRDMLAIAGTIGQGVGLAGPAVAAFAGEIVELAADLQSFHDVPIAETFMAIRSGVTGEAEQLKKFGIILRAVDVDQRALAASGKAIAKELTEAERVTARMALITEKAGVAVGDLARTQDSTANTARQLATVWRQLQEDIAADLLPVFSLVINAWAEISKGAEGAADVIGGISRTLVKFVGGVQMVAVEVNAFIRSMPARLQIFFAKSVEGFINTFVKPVERVINRARALMGKEAIVLAPRLSAIAEAVRERAERELVAWRALIEQEIEAILKAASIAEEAFIAPRSAATPEAGGLEFQRLKIGPIDVPQIEMDTAAAQAFLDDLGRKSRSVAEGMTDAFQSFFEATGSGFEDSAQMWGAAVEAARGAGAAIVEAFTAGQAEKEMALGTAAIASGIWPPNPAAIASGLKHFAAAALFRAIPGVVAGGGAGGGAGAGVSFPRGALGTSLPSARPLGPEINIFIDPLSPADPDFQRAVLGATQSAKERFGENVNVNIHPRTGGVR